MLNDKNQNSNKWILVLKSALILTMVTAVFMAIFSAIMYFAQLDKNLSPLLATVSIAIGSAAASFYVSCKIGNRGYLTGLIVGGRTFLAVTLISLILDEGSLTSNTLFHFIIIKYKN